MRLLNKLVDALVKGAHVWALRSYNPPAPPKDPWKGHPSIGAGHALVALAIAAFICICVVVGAWFALLFFVGAL